MSYFNFCFSDLFLEDKYFFRGEGIFVRELILIYFLYGCFYFFSGE